MNRFAWDFRYDPPVQIPGAFYVGEPPRGPLVIPGTYQVKLTVKGKTQSAPLEVKIDPRIQNQVTAADLQKQIELAVKVQQDIDALHRAVNQIRGLRANLQTLEKWTAAELSEQRSHCGCQSTRPEDVAGRREPDPSEDEEFGGQPALSQHAQRTVRQLQRPDPERRSVARRRSSCWSYDDLHRRLSTQLAKWQQIQTTDVPALNDLMRKNGVPTLSVADGQDK